MKKVSVKTLFLIGIIITGLISLGIGSTYAMFTSNISIDNPITINTTLTCEEEVIDTIDISIEANDFRVIVININNITSSNLNYSSFYISDNSDIEVGVTRSFSDGNAPTGSIGSNSIKKIYIQVKNNSNTKVNITIGVLSNSGNIIKSDNMILINDNNIDTVKPTVSISKNTSSSRSVTYTFNFSKKVSGFTSSDISVSEGTKSTFTKVSDRVYTLVVNHSSDGAKTITINDNACTDISGNGNTSKSLSHTIYTVKPSVTITKNTSISRTVTYTFTFSTDVTGFTSSDISVSEGTKGTFTKVSNSKYTLVVTHSSDGVKTITVSAGVCTDNAGNSNTSKSYSHTIDTVKPSVTISANTSSSRTVTYTFTFSEDVTGFTSSDISVSEGTRGTFTKVSNSKYTLVVTHSSDGVKTITVSAGVCTDNAGNGNTSKSYSHTISTGTPLATYITNLYNNATKTTVTNNSITYNYAKSVNLMNDRLGGTTASLDGGNIRYYGADPNNYIYFNCDDYSNQTSSTCETWRIIGVFEGKVKIMRGSQIGSLAWDQDKNMDSSKTTYDNDWSTSSLQVLLNTSYLNRTANVTYYSGISGTTTTTVSASTIGIKDSTRDMISESMWYLRGYNSSSVYSDQIYEYERTNGSVYSGRPTSWKGKIALAYPSDYGYAADLSQCTKQLGSYNDSTCTSNNWMKAILETSSYGWLLTHNSGKSDRVWNVFRSGIVNYYDYAFNAFGVAPVLYLNSNISIKKDTDGTTSNPFRIVP